MKSIFTLLLLVSTSAFGIAQDSVWSVPHGGSLGKWQSPLPMTAGGTGVGTLTSTGLVCGNGSSPLSSCPGLTSPSQGELVLTDSGGQYSYFVSGSGHYTAHDLNAINNNSSGGINFQIGSQFVGGWQSNGIFQYVNNNGTLVQIADNVGNPAISIFNSFTNVEMYAAGTAAYPSLALRQLGGVNTEETVQPTVGGAGLNGGLFGGNTLSSCYVPGTTSQNCWPMTVSPTGSKTFGKIELDGEGATGSCSTLLTDDGLSCVTGTTGTQTITFNITLVGNASCVCTSFSTSYPSCIVSTVNDTGATFITGSQYTGAWAPGTAIYSFHCWGQRPSSL